MLVAVPIEVARTTELEAGLCISFGVELYKLHPVACDKGHKGNVVGFGHGVGEGHKMLVFHVFDENAVFALRFFRFWKDHRNLLDALRESGLSSMLLERVITCVLNEDYDIRYWLRRNGWEDEKDIIVFNVSGVMALVFRWYYSDFQESPEEMAALLKKILSRPLAPNE